MVEVAGQVSHVLLCCRAHARLRSVKGRKGGRERGGERARARERERERRREGERLRDRERERLKSDRPVPLPLALNRQVCRRR